MRWGEGSFFADLQVAQLLIAQNDCEFFQVQPSLCYAFASSTLRPKNLKQVLQRDQKSQRSAVLNWIILHFFTFCFIYKQSKVRSINLASYLSFNSKNETSLVWALCIQ